MKPRYQREGKDFSPRNRQNDSFGDNRGWNSPRNDNQNFRKINKYKHHAREPRNNIKFEYTISRGKKEIMRSMIDFLRGKTEKMVEDIKRMPKLNPRGVNEVSEDSIATISIEEIQRILKEDVNTVYDALIASDYIEKIAEA